LTIWKLLTFLGHRVDWICRRISNSFIIITLKNTGRQSASAFAH